MVSKTYSLDTPSSTTKGVTGMGKQYKIDSQLARKAVYTTNGTGLNPYPDNTRIHRLWNKWLHHYQTMEARSDELAEVYGEFRPNQLPKSIF